MNLNQFIDGIRFLAERSPLFADTALETIVILNPLAGGLTRPKVFARHAAELETLKRAAEKLPGRRAAFSFRSCATERARHATELAAAIGRDVESNPEAERLVIIAGGDGTSLEFLSGIVNLPEAVRSRFVILRLPLGTGNDGSDGRELTDSLKRLIEPATLGAQCAIRVSPARKDRGPWYAFNIASIGLDAFVTHMTNRLKTKLPGDSYKLWLDIATLFYGRFYRIKPMTILASDSNGTMTMSIDNETLLVAFGVSGNRQYGSNKPILPDEDNVCVIHQMGLLRKLVLKNLISRGEHRGLPEVTLFRANKIVVDYDEKILVQTDGEAYFLETEDFPLVMERTESFIRIIVPKR